MLARRALRVLPRCSYATEAAATATAGPAASSSEAPTPSPKTRGRVRYTAPSTAPPGFGKRPPKLTRDGSRLMFLKAMPPRSTHWRRPVKTGELPVYDEALKYIRDDSASLERELVGLRAKLTDDRTLDEEARREIQAKADVVQIQSEINLPHVRWNLRNGLANPKQLVYRHLLEQRWRKDGPLDLLMERLHTMNCIPDIIPEFHPSFDLRLTFPEPPPRDIVRRTRWARAYRAVEPGVKLLPQQTRRPPRLFATVFHPEPRYYTLILVDPDVPDESNRRFTSYLHWMVPNISLSASKQERILPLTHLKYIPPHPQRGTPYHRYVLLLLPHPDPQARLEIPVPSGSDRLGFNVRQFCETWGFDPASGGGAHMWRCEWNDEVSRIYKQVLHAPEPHFRLLPKQTPYSVRFGSPASK